ncbi:hypothetical protein DSO57_1020965 [Entomophthora muscae]|uniref:Uncharacterized protein n=1 Tax=Entomophthora muscae TaxID=34485 RepID=A0ACC2TED8_9FUNG|nr:hypothetical protein DSO57_1020965 [Entomophthora muscae]
MKLVIVTLIMLSGVASYDSSAVNIFDFPCAAWLGNRCRNWMRCYVNGKFSYTNTKKGCEAANLEFNGKACWARKLRGTLFGGDQSCHTLAPNHCPKANGTHSCLYD